MSRPKATWRRLATGDNHILIEDVIAKVDERAETT
jgi:hypothetical protein